VTLPAGPYSKGAFRRNGRGPLLIRTLRRLALVLALLGIAPALGAQVATQDRVFAQLVEEWRRALDQVQFALGRGDLSREDLDAQRARVDSVRQAAEQARSDAEAQRKPLADQLAALGPAPAAGQPPEAADVARQRKQLVDEIARYDSRIKQAEVTLARAGAIAGNITSLGNEMIAHRLLARERPPLAIDTLTAAAAQLVDVLGTMGAADLAWWRDKGQTFRPVTFVWIGLLALTALGAGWPLRNWLLRRYGHVPSLADPSYARRALAAGAEGLARGFLPAAGLLALGGLLWSEKVVTELPERQVAGVLVGIVFFSLISALARAALAPEAPAWRIVPFGAEASRTLCRRITALAAVAGIALWIGISMQPLRLHAPDFFNVFGLVVNTLAAVLGISLLQRRLWRIETATAASEASPAAMPAHPPEPNWSWPLLRLVLGLALAAVPVLALAGYHNLAAHIVSRVVLTGVVVGVFLLLRTLVRELVTLLVSPESPRSGRLRRVLALTDQGGKFLIFWLGVAVDFVLIVVGGTFTLRMWGVPDTAIGNWVGDALHGVTVGNLRISLADIVLAVVVFVGFWTATRLIQRVLSDKLLPQTRLDPGVRHSLSAMIGYVGFVIAAAFAISTLGLSLANIAIIAGALSVGIGFGLQNIVNNFVSGLILLIERPVKVGDWVVVGQNQGYVTRISVRATEIETFERASVIMPNSELLSSAVVNWTHRDKYGRVDIKVGVAYGSDTTKVRDVLLACARENREILSWPAPRVFFTNFGDSTLDFELRAFIADVESRGSIASDLRFAIDKAFREAGIEMAYPQRDLTLRNVDEIARALAGRPVAAASKPDPEKKADSEVVAIRKAAGEAGMEG